MRLPRTNFEIPTWAVALAAVLFVVSMAYGVLIAESVLAGVMSWLVAVGVGVGLYLVVLFVRLVAAVERIAEES